MPGIDIVTTWRSPAVAAEDGTIKFWTTSARAGCMLYLYGASGTTYLYIHLNNDLTAKRDNKGKCVPGTAYATGLKNGARVKAGQQIAYNGDSGDAEGIYHLHFEVHPKDGADVNPFPYLNAATRLLFALPTKPGKQVTIGMKGTPVSAGAGVLELSVTSVRVWPGGAWTAVPARSVELTVPADALLDQSVAAQIVAPTRRLLSARSATPAGRVHAPRQADVRRRHRGSERAHRRPHDPRLRREANRGRGRRRAAAVLRRRRPQSGGSRRSRPSAHPA